MRFLKLRIRDWRGVTDHEVSFASTGVTVIEGDNEVGKTSLAEAIDLLFDALDSSTADRVKSVQPVGRDVGARVELEVETGPYHFIYRKQFHKRQSTELRVLAPTIESLAGREAHGRVLEILSETVDVPLWKALRLQQGVAIDQADLTGQTSLAVALDAASAADLGGDREETLYTRVTEEWLKYWTRTNKPVAAHAALEQAAVDASTRRTTIERQFAEMAADVERCDALAAKVQETQRRNAEDLAERERLEAQFAELEKLGDHARDLRITAEREQQQLALAHTQLETRQRLINDVQEGEKRERDAASEHDRIAADLPELERTLVAAQTTDTEQQKALDSARKDALRAADDMSHLHDVFNLTSLRERQEHVREARQELAAAAQVLATNTVDSDLLERIDAANLKLVQAEARLNTDGPRVDLLAGIPTRLSLDGVAVDLAAGEQHTWTVTDASTVELPGDVRLTVSAGRSLAGAQAEHASTIGALAGLLQEARVADVATARCTAANRHDAAVAQETANAQLLTHLRDLTEQTLDDLITSHEARISHYQTSRPKQPPLPPHTGAARKLEATAREKVAELEEVAGSARQARDEALAAEQQTRIALVALNTARQTVSEECERLQATVDLARESATDEEVTGQLTECQSKALVADTDARAAEHTYADAAPKAVEAKLNNVRDVIRRATAVLHEDEHSLTALRARLQLRGEQDLYDEQIAAHSLEEATAVDLARWKDRAAAARRLYDTMTDTRAHAQEAYRAPLRERIESFARVVFERDVHIELGSNLQIVSRVLDGQRVGFRSLSMGAREQLSLLARLACACLVSEAGGVPLLLDDALGNTDPGRLRNMGAVLALAGKSCQVIVLTCVPDRYRHVGAATIVRLDSSGVAESEAAAAAGPPSVTVVSQLGTPEEVGVADDLDSAGFIGQVD